MTVCRVVIASPQMPSSMPMLSSADHGSTPISVGVYQVHPVFASGSLGMLI